MAAVPLFCTLIWSRSDGFKVSGSVEIIACLLFLYSIRTAEFCLPSAHLDEALGEVINTAIHYAMNFKQYSLLPIYVRFVKTDDLYLSPANSKCAVDGNRNDHACYIEVQMLNKPKMIMVATTITVTITVTVRVMIMITITSIAITIMITVTITVMITITPIAITIMMTVTITVTVRVMIMITITIMITVTITETVRVMIMIKITSIAITITVTVRVMIMIMITVTITMTTRISRDD